MDFSIPGSGRAFVVSFFRSLDAGYRLQTGVSWLRPVKAGINLSRSRAPVGYVCGECHIF